MVYMSLDHKAAGYFWGVRDRGEVDWRLVEAAVPPVTQLEKARSGGKMGAGDAEKMIPQQIPWMYRYI